MGKKCKCMHFSVLALGIALGILSGLCMFIFALSAWQFNYGGEALKLYTDMLPGFDASLKGAFVGLGWGFVEGFIMGVILAAIYNLCLCCYRCCCCCCAGTSCAPTRLDDRHTRI